MNINNYYNNINSTNNKNFNNFNESIQGIVNQRNNLFKEIENIIKEQINEGGDNESLIRAFELIMSIEEKIKKIKNLNDLQCDISEYTNQTNTTNSIMLMSTSPFSSPILGSIPLFNPSVYSNSIQSYQHPQTSKPKSTINNQSSLEKQKKQKKEEKEEIEELEEIDDIVDSLKPNKPKRGRPLKPKPEFCFRCGTRSCPYWRKSNIKGQLVDVCNACGLHIMKKEKKDLEEKEKNSIKNLLNYDENFEIGSKIYIKIKK
ncbi:hypothetical protein RB653_004280 [Dictyostelium firmibasis]|uniref:GATA-type domain-containing protein n=1 Tax=Dictyostelium firmibasis TaxID=79012 RepID=A0AAN7Z376_9MYCE